MRLDMHAHVDTPRFAETLTRRLGPPAPVAGLKAFMESNLIDASLVSMLGSVDVASATAARMGNEELADVVREEPNRFGALAMVPLGKEPLDAALGELEYALDVLGMDGVILFTNYDGVYLGDPAWDELFAELERRNAYAFVHPSFPPYKLPVAKYPPWVFEFPFETTRAITHLIYSGVVSRYPNVRMQFAHLGGTAPFLAHRIASLAAREPAWEVDALADLGRLFYDTALANNMIAFSTAADVAPVEHVVFGTDWPYLANVAGQDITQEFDSLDTATRAKVHVQNAAALVPRLTAHLLSEVNDGPS
jgi:predicted TIM-barrel fold metal-dependent hydrolase